MEIDLRNEPKPLPTEIVETLNEEASNAAHFVVVDDCRNELRCFRGRDGAAVGGRPNDTTTRRPHEQVVPSCLMRKRRVDFGLESEPREWCIEIGNWPYQAKARAAADR